MPFATPRACAALVALAAIAAAPLPASAGRHYYVYAADQVPAADATIQPEKPYPYENRMPIDTALDAVAVDRPAPQFVTLKQMRIVSAPLSAVHVLPGTYRIRVACESDAYKDTLVSEPVVIEAGRDYFVECRGQTRDQARVSVSSQSAELHGVRGIRSRSFDVPAGTTAEQVGESLQRALKGRGWEVTATAPGRIDAAIHVDDHLAVIRVDYDTTQATFNYVDSTNMDYVAEDGGVASIHRKYYNWINYLGSDLLTYLRGETPQI